MFFAHDLIRKPVPTFRDHALTGICWFGVVVGRLNSECSQQDRANENEHGAHGKHIPFQGKVHGSLPC
jgi:hypothetical protein